MAERAGGEPKVAVLVVDGNANARESVRAALGDRYSVQFAGGVAETFAALERAVPDLLVSEVDLIDGDGLALCAQVRASERLRSMPIMLLTARGSINDKVAGFQAGADDYVVKPLDTRLFHARIRLLTRIKSIEPSNLFSA